MVNCQKLKRLGAEIGALAGRLHALPAPENDRMTQRYRSEAETLIKLGAIDAQLVGQCELLRASLDGKPGDWVLENLATLQGGLAAISETGARAPGGADVGGFASIRSSPGKQTR